MANYNKVILLGNMTRDPQLSYLPSQTAVVEFGLAINRKYKKPDGSEITETCFVDCQMFGKRAEVVNKYFKKGNPIFVEGRLKFDSWQAQDGSKRSKLRVFVENFEFVGSPASSPESGQTHDNNAPGQDWPPPPAAAAPEDDIPF